jgi:hypothetical protein
MAAERPKVNLPFFRCLGAYLLDDGWESRWMIIYGMDDDRWIG